MGPLELDLEVQFHGQRHPGPTMPCKVFGFCHENEQLADWMRKWEWKHSWEDDYEWMRDRWPEALDGLAAVLKSDGFLSRMQLVVCGGPAWFCAMLRAVKAVPMFLYFAWPVVPLIPPGLRPQFLLQIQTLGQATSPPAVMVVANWILAAQFALQVRLPTPVQRVHGLYTGEQHSPVGGAQGWCLPPTAIIGSCSAAWVFGQVVQDQLCWSYCGLSSMRRAKRATSALSLSFLVCV
eukprot:symbB.v1.2.005514.t1/scaffold310.1/size231343/19